jgi:ketosteroid isomerase-like protein
MKKVFLFLSSILLFIVSCNNAKTTDDTIKKVPATASTETKQERNTKVVRACFDNFMKGDIDATYKDVAPGYVEYMDGTSPAEKNIDSVKAGMKAFTNAIEGYKGDNMKYYADGDYVLVYADWSGEFKKDFMGMKATGKPIRFRDIDIFKLNDEGKITEHSSIQNLTRVFMSSTMSN